jgi:hypothetical protein
MTPVEFIGFGKNTVTVHNFNIRPDIWIFPFLNLYGIFGYGSSTTTVNITTPITLTSVVKQNVNTAGFGFTGAFGLGPLFIAADGNWAWNKPEKLNKAVTAKTFSLRLGHTFWGFISTSSCLKICSFIRKPYQNLLSAAKTFLYIH